jgi:hypothetical protein
MHLQPLESFEVEVLTDSSTSINDPKLMTRMNFEEGLPRWMLRLCTAAYRRCPHRAR